MMTVQMVVKDRVAGWLAPWQTDIRGGCVGVIEGTESPAHYSFAHSQENTHTHACVCTIENRDLPCN